MKVLIDQISTSKNYYKISLENYGNDEKSAFFLKRISTDSFWIFNLIMEILAKNLFLENCLFLATLHPMVLAIKFHP